MQIRFCGAARQVTGSRHLLEVGGKRLLLDCGLVQGRRSDAEVHNRDFGFDPRAIDAVILSHAHIDQARSSSSRPAACARPGASSIT